MPEPVTAPTPTAADPKTAASNIAKAVQDKANGKAATPPAQENGQKAAETTADPNAGKKKYTVNKKEIWLTADEADAYVQKGIAFEPKMSHLDRLQREGWELIQKLKTDPLSVLFDKQIGHTPEVVLDRLEKSGQISPEFLERLGKLYYDKAVRPLQMTPEQRALEEATAKNKEYEAREAAAKDQAIKQENQKRVAQAMAQLTAFISEAMKESGLPSNDTRIGADMARMVADEIRIARYQNRSITPKQAIDTVKRNLRDVNSAFYEYLADKDDDDSEKRLEEALGEKVMKRIQKIWLKKAKAHDNPTAQTGSATQNGRRPSKPAMTREEFFEQHLAELKKRG